MADGIFVTDWGGGLSHTNTIANILNPVSTGGSSNWLNPLPAALGDQFAVIGNGNDATIDSGATYIADFEYTSTLTQFRRDDHVGQTLTAEFLNAADDIVGTARFSAVAATDTFETRTLTFSTAGDASLDVFRLARPNVLPHEVNKLALSN